MSSPSKPVSIGSPRIRRREEDGIEENVTQTPDLRQLRQQFGTPPAGTTIPPYRTPGSLTQAVLSSSFRPSSAAELRPQGTVTPLETADASALGEDERMKILRRHLVSREERLGHSTTHSRPSSKRASIHENQTSQNIPSIHPSRPPSPGPSHSSPTPFSIPYHAPGADVTYVCISPLRRISFCSRCPTLRYRHDIYKYQERAERRARPRANSLIVPQHTIEQDPAFEHIHEPGGFRRNYMLLKANLRGLEEPPVTSTFIDFLYLFGHFAGEDLEEDTDEELAIIDEEAPLYVSPVHPTASSHGILRRDTDPRLGEGSSRVRTIHENRSKTRVIDGDVNESTPLVSGSTLQRRASRRSVSRQRRSRRSSISSNGEATVSQAILMVCR